MSEVLRRRDDVAQLDAQAVMTEVSEAPIDLAPNPDGATRHVQLWPHRHGTDAMFLALLQRTAQEG